MNQIEKIIDIATWNRKEHFEHFSAFDDPFFGVTVNVDCTRAYREAKNKGVSFSVISIHSCKRENSSTQILIVSWLFISSILPPPF
jgi:chloramphenicol O-acetyltransferase